MTDPPTPIAASASSPRSRSAAPSAPTSTHPRRRPASADTWPSPPGVRHHVLRVDPAKLDAHFLAGCLRGPSNGRQAGTHASSSSRVGIRRLQVLQLPLAEQAAYAEVFRDLRAFEAQLGNADGAGRGLVSDVVDLLAAGGLDV